MGYCTVATTTKKKIKNLVAKVGEMNEFDFENDRNLLMYYQVLKKNITTVTEIK